MRFKSATGVISLALTSGHTAVITEEFAELSPIFHREAIANGAIAEGAATVEAGAGDQSAGFNRNEIIIEAIEDMLDGADDKDFTGDGKPDAARLSARVGFTVDRAERDAIWGKMMAESDKDSKPDEPPDTPHVVAPVAAPAVPAATAPSKAASKKA